MDSRSDCAEAQSDLGPKCPLKLPISTKTPLQWHDLLLKNEDFKLLVCSLDFKEIKT